MDQIDLAQVHSLYELVYGHGVTSHRFLLELKFHGTNGTNHAMHLRTTDQTSKHQGMGLVTGVIQNSKFLFLLLLVFEF